jgi:hypothetical protein
VTAAGGLATFAAMSTSDEGPRRPTVLPTLATGLCVAIAGLAMFLDLRGQLARSRDETRRLADRLGAVEQTLQLLRFEQQSKTGLGITALLEQLRHWAPQLAMATTTQAQLPAIQGHVNAILEAFHAIGPSALPQLLDEFRKVQPGSDEEIQKWLLRAMREVDLARAKDVLADCVRGLEVTVSPGIRLFAASELIGVDRELAGEVLRRILQTESYRGIDVHRMDPQVRAKYPNAAQQLPPFSGFWNFVQLFVATKHPDVEQTLLGLIERSAEHDLLTLQECVKSLGELRSRDAVKAIENLFEAPPRGYTPMFRNHCLDALASILGREACPYFQSALQRETLDTVRTKLADLINRDCGS